VATLSFHRIFHGLLNPQGDHSPVKTEGKPNIHNNLTRNKTIFQYHAPLPAATSIATTSSSSIINSNIISNKLYVLGIEGSANKVSAAVLTYDYDTECFQTLSLLAPLIKELTDALFIAGNVAFHGASSIQPFGGKSGCESQNSNLVRERSRRHLHNLFPKSKSSKC